MPPQLNSEQSGSQQSETTLFTLVESVFRHSRLLLATVLLTLLAGLAIAFIPAAKYESEMMLLVQNGRANATISAGATGTAAAPEVTDAQVNSEVDVLNSNDVLDEVVDPGWTSIPVEQRTNEAVKEHLGKVSAFRSRMTVTPGRKSRSLLVQYRTTDPRRAYESTQRLLTAFLNKQKDLSQPAQAPQFFSDEAARYKQLWQDAQAELIKFQTSHQVVSILDKEAGTEKQLFELQSQEQLADVTIRETEGKIHAQQLERNSQPQRVKTAELSSDLITTLEGLNTQVVTLQLKRTELLTKFRPDDRLVQEVDRQLVQVRTAIEDLKNRHSSTTTTNVNPTWLAADEALSESRSILTAAKARRQQLETEIAQMTHSLNGIAADSGAYSQLDTRVTELQNNYILYAKKRDEALANSGMDAVRLLNVAVVESPSYSPDAVRPRPLLDILLALFSALFLGGLALFIAEVSRSTFTSARDLDALRQHEVLASVPFEGRR